MLRPAAATCNSLQLSLLVFLLSIGLSESDSQGQTAKSAPKAITVSAAASTTEVLEAAAVLFKAQSNISVDFDFGSSGALARKIEAGAPTDIFVTADEKWLTYLEEKKLIVPESRLMFARNILVCAVPAASATVPAGPRDLLGLELISIGDPEHVPAGKYAMEALKHFKIWDKMMDQGKLVLTQDVRAVLANVETGVVEAGLVYRTDAMLSKKVKTAFEFLEESHTPVTYITGVLAASKSKAAAAAFVAFLKTARFHEILKKQGFQVP